MSNVERLLLGVEFDNAGGHNRCDAELQNSPVLTFHYCALHL